MRISSMQIIIIAFACHLLMSCSSSNPEKSAPHDEHTVVENLKSKDATPIDFKLLFELSEQEELDLYNNNEQLLLAKENVETFSAKLFVESLLPDLEKGVTRKVLLGSRNGLEAIQGIEYIIIIDSNIPDDSLESDIRFFEIRKTAKAWSLSAVSSVWKCYKGRGHESYSTAPCD